MMDINEFEEQNIKCLIAAKRGRAIIAAMELRFSDRDRLNDEANRLEFCLHKQAEPTK